MRISTYVRCVWNGARYVAVEERGYEWNGELAMAGGGPAASQVAAAKSQADLTQQTIQQQQKMTDIWANSYNTIKGPATDMATKGLSYFPALTDYSNGTLAQSYKPQYAGLNRSMSSMGALPSGFKTQATNDLRSQQARDFDMLMGGNLAQNENAKITGMNILAGQQGAANPLGYTQAAMQGNNSILSAQSLQTPGLASVLGGVAGSAAGMFKFTCYVAAAVFNEDMMGEKTCLVRNWLWKEWSKNWYAKPILGAYRRWGKWVSQQPILVRALTPLFQLALRKAGGGR